MNAGQFAAAICATYAEAIACGLRLTCSVYGVDMGATLAAIGHNLLGYADALGYVTDEQAAAKLRSQAAMIFRAAKMGNEPNPDDN